MTTTADHLAHIRARIAAAAARSGRAADEIELVAVAKTATPTTLREAWEAGQRVFGHNQVQALEEHRGILPQACWHLLGPLQGRKVRRGLAASQCFQALGEFRTLQRCERALEESQVFDYPVLLQVNLHPEDGRYGCHLEDLDSMMEAVLDSRHLHPAGLMTLAQQAATPSQLRRDFSTLHQHFRRLQDGGQLDLRARLSMGMSQDFETAIEEGANLVRVGQAIFPPIEE